MKLLPGLTFVTLLAMALLSACAAQPFAKSSEDSAVTREAARPALAPAPGVAPGAPAQSAAGAPAPKAAAAQPAGQGQGGQVPPIDTNQRMIQRTASITLLVEDISQATTQVRVLAEGYPGGYVVNAAQREEGGRPASTVTIRVPAERYDEVMAKLRAMAVRVTTEQVNARDITEEFVDTDARLRNLKATEERYLELLQQARTVEDILKVEQQLSNIRGQIEQLQGRLNLLSRSASTSAITVELRLPAAAQGPAPSDWSVLPVFRNAWAALLSTAQFLVAALIWAFIFTPLWLPLLLGIRWLLRRRRARRAAAAATPAHRTAGPAPAS